MSEWGEKQTFIKFCVKLELSSTETIHMIQKAAAIGNWWLTVSSPVHLLMYHVLCRGFWEASNHSGDSVTLQPRFGALWLLAFPKTKITFERKEISDHWWNSGKYDGAADGDWENCVMSQGAYWSIIILCTMFLISCIFFNKCLYFSYNMSVYFLDRPHRY